MRIHKLQDWIADKSGPGWYAYVKRLSANDTGLTGGHGSGIYIPAEMTQKAFPSLLANHQLNPDVYFMGRVDSHDMEVQDLRAIYYNSRVVERRLNGRNEQRITHWKKNVDYAPLQDPENTGALTVVAFLVPEHGGDIDLLQVWVCNDVEEEDYLESMIGDVLPAVTVFRPFDQLLAGNFQKSLFDTIEVEIPALWGEVFPSGAEITDFVVKHYAHANSSPDERLLKRRDDEYRVFQQVEDLHVLPVIGSGFDNVADFIAVANSISNRRKSRAGRSLELHLEHIFAEEGLTAFETQALTEGHKKPDFLFPGARSYMNHDFPDEGLNMLAVKTTLKDRWRQVINEADRIPLKYLFTLQEGVSENQFREMSVEGVQLVVPGPIRKRFPKSLQAYILTLDEFIDRMKQVQSSYLF
ncbi:type II restriction endonuclease [Pseudomonadota bacterium]